MESQLKQAYIVSLRLLAATPKTRSELAKKLADKGFAETVVDSTLRELEKNGILSDRNYARDLVSKLTNAKPSGSKLIGFELKRRGISAALREEILSSISPEDESARAREIARDKWQRFSNLIHEKRKKKVFDFLIRRGFDYQVVRDVLDRIETGNQSTETREED